MTPLRKNWYRDLLIYAMLIIITQTGIWALAPYTIGMQDLKVALGQGALVFPYWERSLSTWEVTPYALSMMAKLILSLFLIINLVPMFLVSLFTGLPASNLRKANQYTRLFWRFKSPVYYLYLPLIVASWIIFPYFGHIPGLLYWLFTSEQNFHAWIFMSAMMTFSIIFLLLSWRNHLKATCPECGAPVVLRPRSRIICNNCLTIYRLKNIHHYNDLYDYHNEVLEKAEREYPKFRQKPLPKNAEFHTLYPRSPLEKYLDSLFN